METQDIIRAQYNTRDHRFDFELSPRFKFDIELGEDNEGEYCYIVTVTSKENGTLVGQQYAHSLEDAHGLVSEWWAQLSIEHTDTAMWGIS
jgi:hypothetical protein